MNILAGMVTHNRAGMLTRSLDAITNQTLPPKDIVVIDNLSTDETSKVLDRYAERGVKSFKTGHNIGGAGGFALLMSVFLAGDWDALLLCDDDGLADHAMLSELTSSLSDLDVANALVLSTEDSSRLAFGFSPTFILARLKTYVTTFEELAGMASNNIVTDLITPFNGTLIKRKVIESIGIVDPRMFIWGDELEFMLRVKNAGFRLGTVMSARAFHPKSTGTNTRKTLLGTAYMPAKARAHLVFRNGGLLDRKIGKRVRGFLRSVKLALIFAMAGEFALAAKQVMYYVDGYTGAYVLSPAAKHLVRNFEEERVACEHSLLHAE